jgi:hypothetical protein
MKPLRGVLPAIAAAIRYHRSRPDWHTFRGNTLGVGPADNESPRVVAARTGLEPEYSHLDASPIHVAPTPILTMEILTP